jgi:hypothetical protein
MRVHLYIDSKTIPSSNIGLAGGKKYFVPSRGIFIKVALDSQNPNGDWIYGGKSKNDNRALKSASQEFLASDYLG